jgi:hypothetical protein
VLDDPSVRGDEYLCGWGEGQDVPAQFVAYLLNTIKAGYSTYVFAQCFAGGILDALRPVRDGVFGCAAANHFEGSIGDGFAAAFTTALNYGYRYTRDAYSYAYWHDPYAIWGDEHPSSDGGNFPIFYREEESAPTLGPIAPLEYGQGSSNLVITYDLLQAAANTSDAEGDAAIYRVETVDGGMLTKDGRPARAGTTLGFGESLVWTPPAGAQNTVNAFTVKATDGVAASANSQAVRVRMGPPSGSIAAVDDLLEIPEDSPPQVVAVLTNDRGAAPLRVVGVGVAGHGTVSLLDGEVRYSPAPNYNGSDVFSYTVADASGETDMATVSVTITAVNRAPEAWDQLATIISDTVDNRLDVLANVSDPDVDPLTLQVLRDPSHGDLKANSDGSLSYTPDRGFRGADSFLYRVSDGQTVSRDATVTIDVQARTDYYFSTTAGGTVKGSDGRAVTLANTDIVRLSVQEGGQYQYSLHFDGSDAGLTAPSENIDAFAILPDGSLVISTRGSVSVSTDYLAPGQGSGPIIKAGGQDLLRFEPVSLGDNTAGHWSVYFDGSDVGLTTAQENIDAVQVLPTGELAISTTGPAAVEKIRSQGEDLLLFMPTQLGSATGGKWLLYFDGSDAGLSGRRENVDALSILPGTNGGLPTLFFSTAGKCSAKGVSGSDDDVFGFVPTALGANTRGAFRSDLLLRSAGYGLGAFNLDGLAVVLSGEAGNSAALHDAAVADPAFNVARPTRPGSLELAALAAVSGLPRRNQSLPVESSLTLPVSRQDADPSDAYGRPPTRK